MTFFFDRNIARRLARMLDAYDADNAVRHQDDDVRFDEQSKDVDIISTLADEDPKPVFITADLNMYSKYPDERAALAESGLTRIFHTEWEKCIARAFGHVEAGLRA